MKDDESGKNESWHVMACERCSSTSAYVALQFLSAA